MPTHVIRYPVKEIFIELHIRDACSIGANKFNSLHEFKLFLTENPEIVKLLKEGIDRTIRVQGDIDLETRI